MTTVRPAKAGARPRANHRSRRLQLESLESRLALTAATGIDSYSNLMTHGGACSCPICSGQGLETLRLPGQQITVVGQPAAGAVGAPPVGVPDLSSLPGASATLFLDFDGHVEASWGSDSNVVTTPYDQDGNTASYSAAEIANMREIWARVAEDFAPFNINVTTVAPALIADRVAVRICIGGDWDDWFGSPAGGVAYVGGFYNGASNVAYVFEDALGNGNAKYTAEATSHEAGHLFGLWHQAVWNGTSLTEEYNPGTSEWAPIMGVGYYSSRTTWHNGPTSDSPSSLQDNMSVLANSSNGFGYRSDDFGSTTGSAATLPVSGTSVDLAGIIGTNGDVDLFRFTSGGGALNLTLSVAQFGANLDSVLEILNSSGAVVATANSPTAQGAALSTSLASGTYYVSVHSSGGYGNVGQYTLSGTVPAGVNPAPPEISLSVSGSELSDGGALSLGTTTIGTPVTRTVTVTNSGGGTLDLTALGTSLPTGFTLVSNVGDTTLNAGQSTTFAIRLVAATAGNFSGAIALTNSDGDENPFNLQLSGVVSAAPTNNPVVRIIDNGASGFSTTGAWTRRMGEGRDGDNQFAVRGNGSFGATWSFAGLEAGSYRVSATWPRSSIYATNAPFTVFDGTRSMATVRVNQESSPSSFTSDGTSWRDLGTFTISGNQLVVKLTNAANDRVVADAIRIERVAPTGTLRPVFASLGAPSAAATIAASSARLAWATISRGGANAIVSTSPAGPDAAGSNASSPAWQHDVVLSQPRPAQANTLVFERSERLLEELAIDVIQSSRHSLLDDLLGSA